MWCVGRLTEEYRTRMYALLELYAKPYTADEPVVCIDEKSKQLHQHSRAALPMKPGVTAKQDYEYVRKGTCNLFVAVEPKGQRRVVEVTARRTKLDFVGFVRQLVEHVYASAKTVHIVLDNLNTHFRASFEQVMGAEAAAVLLQRVLFHYTPKHASWLNMAEIEIGILDRQCLARRLHDRPTVATEVAAWQHRRNAEHRGIDWTFTRQDADLKLKRHYVS
jgi:DDE superfamily endonuclease